MSQHPEESRDSQATGPDQGITDDKLPADLQPTDDNPLAQPLEGEDVKSPEELDVLGGKAPEQREQDDSGHGTDSEG